MGWPGELRSAGLRLRSKRRPEDLVPVGGREVMGHESSRAGGEQRDRRHRALSWGPSSRKGTAKTVGH